MNLPKCVSPYAHAWALEQSLGLHKEMQWSPEQIAEMDRLKQDAGIRNTVPQLVRWAQYTDVTISAHPDNHEKIKAFAAQLDNK